MVRNNTCTTILHHLNTCNSLKCLVETVQNSYQLFSKFSERCSWQSADIQLGSHLWRVILRGVIIYTRTKTGVNLNKPQDHVHFPTENSYKPSTFICLRLKLLSWINFTTKKLILKSTKLYYIPTKPAKPVYTWSLLCRPDDGSRFLLGTEKKKRTKQVFV